MFPKELVDRLKCAGRGVGLRLTGVPTDDREFIRVLHDQSCNPVAARIILRALTDHGERYTTVVGSVLFEKLIQDLKELSVTVTIVEPREPPEDQDEVYLAALHLALEKIPRADPAILVKAQALADQVKLDRTDLGPYSWILKEA